MRLNLDSTTETDHEPPWAAMAEQGLDENLHFGRAWHRYRYCHRVPNPLRVLDVGCGTGATTLALATINPGANVHGVDATETAIALATEHRRAPGSSRMDFVAHDPTIPFPESLRGYDFVVCRSLIGRSEQPDRVLENLARAVAPNGLVLAGFPSRNGRMAARLLRQAVDALIAPAADLEDRVRIGMSLIAALRPEHPIRAGLAQASALAADPPSSVHRFVLDALTNTSEWSLDEATRALERAGLRFLYAATPWRWLPDRAFAQERFFGVLRDAIESLPPESLSTLIDALDPSAFGECHALYACPIDYHPPIPEWPHARHDDPDSFDALIPQLTGLAWPDVTIPKATASQGRTLYRTIGGALGELDRISVLRLGAIDGVESCGSIDQKLSARMRASDGASTRQNCWIQLADAGFIMLQTPPRS